MTNDQNSNTNSNTTGALESLVGPGKKFADAEALAKGKAESDAFITKLVDEKRTLEQEALRLQNENLKLKARSSILNQLDDSDNDNDNNTQTKVTPDVKGLSPEDVAKMIKNDKLEERKLANQREVDAVISRVLGDKAKEVLTAKAGELGLTPEALVDLAKDNPRLFYASVGINPNATTTNSSMYQPGNSSVDSNSQPVRNKAFYDKLQKDMGTLKFIRDSKLQVQLHKDAQALGDKWDAA